MPEPTSNADPQQPPIEANTTGPDASAAQAAAPPAEAAITAEQPAEQLPPAEALGADALLAALAQPEEAQPPQPAPELPTTEPAAPAVGQEEAARGPAVVGATTVAVAAEDAVAYEPRDLAAAAPAEQATIELLDDVELDVKVELGRTSMYIEDVLRLGPGSVVELDKLAGDPVDIYVNERLIARGEVLVLNDNFCVRINDITSPIPELEHA
ncbi:MAG: flagellar motor switch protein FliN [Planctomycetota bacterium]